MIASRLERAGTNGVHDAAHDRVIFKMAAGGGPVNGIHILIMVNANPRIKMRISDRHGALPMDRDVSEALQSLASLELSRRSRHASAIETEWN